jgi:aconitase A
MVSSILGGSSQPLPALMTLHVGAEGARSPCRRRQVNEVHVTAAADSGARVDFAARLRIETPHERDYLRHGGILRYALRERLAR